MADAIQDVRCIQLTIVLSSDSPQPKSYHISAGNDRNDVLYGRFRTDLSTTPKSVLREILDKLSAAVDTNAETISIRVTNSGIILPDPSLQVNEFVVKTKAANQAQPHTGQTKKNALSVAKSSKPKAKRKPNPDNLSEKSPLNAAESDLAGNTVIEEGQQLETETARAESILERFDGFVEQLDGDKAYVTLKSREHGDILYGEYSATLLRSKGIEEQDRFICTTVSMGEATRVDIDAVPLAIVTKEQIQAIDEEIERILPSDDSIDF